jgi:hypothetical protein
MYVLGVLKFSFTFSCAHKGWPEREPEICKEVKEKLGFQIAKEK